MHLHLYTHLVEPILSYVRMLRFTGPEQVKRYYRMFGDLEYDLLSLRAESAVMRLKLREIRRRITTCAGISDEEEKQINIASHDLAEHYYNRADRLQRAMTASRSFRFDATREQQSFYLLSDIAYAIMGIEDRAVRGRERETLNIACEAYGRLDISALLDLHEGVQRFLSLQRRERLDEHEEQEWRQKLEDLKRTHPMCCIRWLDDSTRVRTRMERLKNKINREQRALEQLNLVYIAAVATIRHRN